MSLYLLHFDPPYRHASHYLGFTPDPHVDRRCREHLDGVRHKASPLVLAALDAGSTVVIARRWEGAQYGRKEERAKKNRGHAWLCPICKARQKVSPTR